MFENTSNSLVPLQLVLPFAENFVVGFRPQHKKRHPSLIPTHQEGRFKADVCVNLAYLSEIDLNLVASAETLIVKSPIGSGKTRLAAQLIARLTQTLGRSPRVLVLTHRQALAKDLTKRLNRELCGTIFECYKGLSGAELRQIDRLIICLNSVPKLFKTQQLAPRYDLIVIDEIEQFLAHLNGGTFKGGAALQAHDYLRALVTHAGRVVVMDADAGPTSRNWLKGLRPSTFTLINTHVPDRGEMFLYATLEKLVEESYRLIAEDRGPVVIATNSKREARKLEQVYRDRYGDAAVRMLYSGNSGKQESQTFIQNIDEELPKLRVFIYTPSLGTGVDIQCPVRAMLGIFYAEPLASTELYQMLGRCRKVEETHVYVDEHIQNRQTDADAIYRRHCNNAIETGKQCAFNEHGLLDVTPRQGTLLRLLSTIEARRNQTKNQLHSHFRASAAGYRITWVPGSSEHTRRMLKKAGEQVDEEIKQLVMNAECVDDKSYDQIHAKTPEIETGNQRYKIETLVGCAITEPLYDDFHTVAQRKTLECFTDLLDDEKRLEDADRDEARAQVPMNKRSHRLVRRRLLFDLLVGAFGQAWSTEGQEYAKDEFEARIKFCLDANAEGVTNQFGRRTDASQNPVARFRWLLKRVGLSLDSLQVTKEGKRMRVYSLDSEKLLKMQTYAQSRLASLNVEKCP